MFDLDARDAHPHHHQPGLQRRPHPGRDPVRDDDGPRRSRDAASADYLWNVKSVVPFLKVDKGLADEEDGAQVMKPMPDLDALLDRAKAQGRVRHQDALGHQAGRRRASRRWSTSSSRSAGRCSATGLVPIIEPEVDIHSPREGRGRGRCSRRPSSSSSISSATDQLVMLKLTLPEADNFYAELVKHPKCCGWWRCPAATAATRPTRGWPATTA